jgi:hypothetical protein
MGRAKVTQSGRLDECLNRELLANLLEAQSVVDTFRDKYNEIRL